jgi:dephospho-CoA kinase
MRVGITGGIGSGKTTVCRVFSVIGIPVFYADEEAKKLTESDIRVIEGLSAISGTDLYSDGVLDRKRLATIIFNDNEKLLRVNALIHPLVGEVFTSWVEQQNTPYVILESAILFDSVVSSLVDKVIAVTAPLDERINRVVIRSGLTPGEVKERIRNQLSEEEIIKRSDYVIHNGDMDMVIPKVLELNLDILNILGN